MVGLFLSSRDAQAIRPTDQEIPAGAEREEMPHITLAIYPATFGEQGMREKLIECIEGVADYIPPVDVTLDGIGVFKNDKDVVYAKVVSDSIDWLRNAIVDRVTYEMNTAPTSDYGFNPHVTLYYAPPGEDGNPVFPPTTIRFAQLTIAFGNEHVVLPLCGDAISRYMHCEEDAKTGGMGDMQDMADGETGTSQWTLLKSTAEDTYKTVINGTYVPPEGTKYVWVGVATNAYQDKTDGPFNILPLQALQDDIERKALMIKQGAITNYGLLDVMHEHDMTIGVCMGRTIVDGTRMEVDWGYIDPEFNDLAEVMKSREFTMSHETELWYSAGKTKIKLPKSVARALSKTIISRYLFLDTFRFTVARVGLEANARTYFRVYEFTGGSNE